MSEVRCPACRDTECCGAQDALRERELRLNEQEVREVLDRRVFGLRMALVQITMMGDGEGLEAAYEGREKMRREAVRAVIADQAVVDAAAEGCRPTGCGTHNSPHECAVAKAVRRG